MQKILLIVIDWAVDSVLGPEGLYVMVDFESIERIDGSDGVIRIGACAGVDEGGVRMVLALFVPSGLDFRGFELVANSWRVHSPFSP